MLRRQMYDVMAEVRALRGAQHAAAEAFAVPAHPSAFPPRQAVAAISFSRGAQREAAPLQTPPIWPLRKAPPATPCVLARRSKPVDLYEDAEDIFAPDLGAADTMFLV